MQQIVALRYFGFSQDTVKTILQKHHNIYAHLQAQQQVIKEQSDHLQQVNNALGGILKRLSPSETPDWNDLITLIEGYRMTINLRDKLKKTWAAQFSEEQFEEYLSIYEQFPEEFSQRDKIIDQINNEELGDPMGPDGHRVVCFMNDFAKKMKKIFTKQIKFNSSLLEEIKSGRLSQFQTTPEGTLWVSQAMLSYWLKRWDTLYDHIVENLKSDPEGEVGKKIANQWNDLIDEYFSMGNRSFLAGIILWQDVARQAHEINGLTEMMSPQEMMKKVHIKLFFNSEAISWISRAIEANTK